MILTASLPAREPVTLNLQPRALTVAWNNETVLAYDRGGRLWSVFIAGSTFRRGLDGSMLAKRSQAGARERRRLRASEASLVVEYAADRMAELSGGRFDAPPEIEREVRDRVERAASFREAAAREDARRFLQIYKPIGILPPDQYLALVLQLTEGCSFNTCTFCTLYRDRPFHIKSPDEFRRHIQAAREFLGDSLALRRGVFLGDANALAAPHERLVALLDVLDEFRQCLPPPPQIFAFLDGFSGRKKSERQYTELAQRGLARVYIGLESGHDPLLAWLHKPGRAGDAVEAVRAIKAAGISVCVIVLLGAGGARFAQAHVRDTLSALQAMQLSVQDWVYFSELIQDSGQGYGGPAAQEWISSLSVAEMQSQRRAIEAGLRVEPRPRCVTYDIREFIY